jgi:multidrug efflux pump subunit AcrA (membrane-fusion protein)
MDRVISRLPFARVIASCAELVLGLAAFAGCSHSESPKAPPPPSVAVTVAREASLNPAQTLPGLIAPYQSVAIQSDLTEPADEVNVQEGDRVTKGEVLARLDTADLEANLAADLATAQSDAATTTHTVYQGGLTIAQSQQSARGAQAALRQAQETLRKDELDLTRYQQLFGSGFISQQQLATQIALVANDRQAVRSAQSALASDQDGATVSCDRTSRARDRATGAHADRQSDDRLANRWRRGQPQPQRRRVSRHATDLHLTADGSDVCDRPRLRRASRGHRERCGCIGCGE